VRVFYSYSHEDAAMMQSVRSHLAMLRRSGLIEEWFDRDIEAGQQWRVEIAEELERADLVLLLVSADFLNSDFCYEEEMTRALERANEGATRVVAVLLRPVAGWEDSPFAHLQVTPQDGRAVTTWPNQDEALADVASRVKRVVERIRDEQTPTIVPRVDETEDAGAAALRAALSSALDKLVSEGQGHFLIAAIGPYFAQFLFEDRGMWCETVSNTFLDEQTLLDDSQEATLRELGWNPPDETLTNWWWAAPGELSSDEIATLVVRTLLDAYRIESTQAFAFEYGE
jgi:T3SS (YopN, CesT) and YbjN peptide-binding chaperone 3/TIR domain